MLWDNISGSHAKDPFFSKGFPHPVVLNTWHQGHIYSARDRPRGSSSLTDILILDSNRADKACQFPPFHTVWSGSVCGTAERR